MISQDYQNQIVFITGGASGIGLAQVQTYLDLGARVWVLDRHLVPIQHDNLITFQVDLGDVRAVTAWLKETDLSQIDIFLSTAGVLDAFTPALDTNYEAIQQLMAINVNAAVQITLPILAGMVKRQRGTIVYMTSIAGQVAGGGGAAYTMSKHALVVWMKQLALDYADKNIHINGIAPGAVNTPMNAADFAGDGAMAKEVAAQTPIHRWSQAQEVADLTLYLTSPEARYVQGQVFTIDGGWTIK